MDANTYKFGFKGAKETIKLQKYALLVMAITILLLVIFAINKRERLVLIPPIMDERVELAYQSGNEDY